MGLCIYNDSTFPILFTGFLLYAFLAISLSVYLIYWVAPIHGQTNILVYISICSAIGSLTVVGCKGLSIAIKLTLEGHSQLGSPLSWFFLISVIVCITVQMNYLNKSLDIFNTSLVTPIYYVMFTTLTITASAILFKEWEQLNTKNIVGSLCGFATIVCGVFLLHAFKDVNFSLRDLIPLTGNRSRPASQGEGISIVVMETNRGTTPPVWADEHSGSVQLDEEELNTTEVDLFLPRTSQS